MTHHFRGHTIALEEMQLLIMTHALVSSGDAKGVSLYRLMAISDLVRTMQMETPSVKMSFDGAIKSTPTTTKIMRCMDSLINKGLIAKTHDEDIPPEIKVMDGESFIYRQTLYITTNTSLDCIRDYNVQKQNKSKSHSPRLP